MHRAESCSQPFCHAHDGAARARILPHFALGRTYRLSDQTQFTSGHFALSQRQTLWHLGICQPRHETLDDTVFQRVKTDHDQASARLEACHALRQAHLQLFKLLIDENPYSLEGTRRRILPWLTRGNGFSHDLGKFPRAL